MKMTMEQRAQKAQAHWDDIGPIDRRPIIQKLNAESGGIRVYDDYPLSFQKWANLQIEPDGRTALVGLFDGTIFHGQVTGKGVVLPEPAPRTV